MADPPFDDRSDPVQAPADDRVRQRDEEFDARGSGAGLALLLAVGALMTTIVAGLVWSTGHALGWW